MGQYASPTHLLPPKLKWRKDGGVWGQKQGLFHKQEHYRSIAADAAAIAFVHPSNLWIAISASILIPWEDDTSFAASSISVSLLMIKHSLWRKPPEKKSKKESHF
jgi:hypothetical protein